MSVNRPPSAASCPHRAAPSTQKQTSSLYNKRSPFSKEGGRNKPPKSSNTVQGERGPLSWAHGRLPHSPRSPFLQETGRYSPAHLQVRLHFFTLETIAQGGGCTHPTPLHNSPHFSSSLSHTLTVVPAWHLRHGPTLFGQLHYVQSTLNVFGTGTVIKSQDYKLVLITEITSFYF